MRLRLLAMLAFLPLAACASLPAGNPGTLAFSPELQAHYDQYRAQLKPGAFAVSTDGRVAAYTYCPEFGGCMSNGTVSALARCRRSGKPCILYDVGGQVVWRGTVTRPQPRVPGLRV